MSKEEGGKTSPPPLCVLSFDKKEEPSVPRVLSFNKIIPTPTPSIPIPKVLKFKEKVVTPPSIKIEPLKVSSHVVIETPKPKEVKPATPTFPKKAGMFEITEDEVLEMSPGLSLSLARRAASLACSYSLTEQDGILQTLGWPCANKCVDHLRKDTLPSMEDLDELRVISSAAWAMSTKADTAKSKILSDRAAELEEVISKVEERLPPEEI